MEQREVDAFPVGWLRVAVGVLLLGAVASLFWVWHEVTWLDIEEIGRHERASRAESGITLLGTGRSVALAVSGCVAAVGVFVWARTRLAWVLAAVVGVAFVCSSSRVLFEWRGSDLRLTAVVPLAAGAAAAGLGVWELLRRRGSPVRRVRELIEAVVLAAVVVGASGWPLRHTTPASGFAEVGPFEQIATSDHHYGFGDWSTDVVISDGRPALLAFGNLWTVDGGGRSALRVEADDVETGIIDGRVVVWDDEDVLIVDVERDHLWVTIPDATPRSVSTDGTLWLTDRTGDNPDTVYRVDISRLPASGVIPLDQLEAFELDRGDLDWPWVSTRDALYWIGGLAGSGNAVYRWRAGEDVRPERIAGGHDPACGQLADPQQAHLDISAIAVQDNGRWLWIAAGSNEAGGTGLYRLGPLDDDEAVLLRADVETSLSIGPMVVDEHDLIVLNDDDDDGEAALWRLPAPGSLLEELPEDGPDCVPGEPPAVGEPPRRRAITEVTTGEDTDVVPLSTDGHHALVVDDRRIHLVGPSGTTQRVLAFDGRAISVVTPDGEGGLWLFAEDLDIDPEDRKVALVHVDPDGEIDQEIPDSGVRWPVDLVSGTGGTPAILTDDGLLTLGDDGHLIPVLDESWNINTIDSMVGDGDGGLWLVRDGVLYSVIDGEATPVAGDDQDVNIGTAWSVQLARGVPPSELWLGDAMLERAADGRVVLVGREDGVVLAVDAETGDVEVVGQDPELSPPDEPRLLTVDGGVVSVEDEPASDDERSERVVIEEVVL